MTVEKRVNIARSFIDKNYIIDEDLAQELYLCAIEVGNCLPEIDSEHVNTDRLEEEKKIIWHELLITVSIYMKKYGFACFVKKISGCKMACEEECTYCKKFKRNQFTKSSVIS